MSQYPEHDKLKAVQEESQCIGEFLEHAGYTLAEWVTEPLGVGSRELMPVRKPITEVLAEYFSIDLKTLEEEKRDMLDSLRS